MNIFKKKITLIGDVFPNSWILKTWLNNCLKSPFSEDSSKSNIINWPKHYSNLNGGTFATFIDYCEGNSAAKSLLVICKSLRLFVNTLTADSKYSLHNKDNLTSPMQILISEKGKVFLHFFVGVLKSILNFEHFQKKMMSLIADVFAK